jgi:kinesin family protein 1
MRSSSAHRRQFESHPLSPIPEHSSSKYDASSGVGGENNARIRVLVRVRPLDAKEKARGHKMIIQNDSEQTLTVWDPAAFETRSASELASLDPKCWAKQFSFDKILWSASPYDANYADQNHVFELLGQPVINWIIEGYNSCVLAYGQTGTGKTYTMSGDMRGEPNEYGLVPRICFGLFDQLESQYIEGDDVTVNFSHMEIYNENVRDLLAPTSNGYLRVREHPLHGVFVSNLTTVKVGNFEDVMSLIAIGDKNRTVASTNSNTHSSRSHAIVTITVVQRKRCVW